jgi:hypothetical protein
MPIVSTKDKTAGNWLKREFWIEEGFCRKVVTMNDVAQTLATGTVLGKVTADGKYKTAVETAVDGSEVADAIFIAAVVSMEATAEIPATTDTEILVLIKGAAIVGTRGLVLDASYDDDAKVQAVYDALEAKDINVDESF